MTRLDRLWPEATQPPRVPVVPPLEELHPHPCQSSKGNQTVATSARINPHLIDIPVQKAIHSLTLKAIRFSTRSYGDWVIDLTSVITNARYCVTVIKSFFCDSRLMGHLSALVHLSFCPLSMMTQFQKNLSNLQIIVVKSSNHTLSFHL